MSEGAPSMVTGGGSGGGGGGSGNALTNNLFSLSALAALQPNLSASLNSMSPALDFTHGSATVEADAKLIDYRSEKVAGFEIDGDTMICLPQAYELFLKSLVGGLHTVYTKLKRLDITPRVCNVEQVRALRSLGAIQPGVNRCKLISCKDFDALYEDCTSTNRPGRPPKRSPLSNVPVAGVLDHNTNWSQFFKRPKFDINGNNNDTTACGTNKTLNGNEPPTSNGTHPAGLINPFSAQLMMQHMMSQGLMHGIGKLPAGASNAHTSHNSNGVGGHESDHNGEGDKLGSSSRQQSESPTGNDEHTGAAGGLWIDEAAAAAADNAAPLNLSKALDNNNHNNNHNNNDNNDNNRMAEDEDLCCSSDQADLNVSDDAASTPDNELLSRDPPPQQDSVDDPLQQFLASMQNPAVSKNGTSAYASVQALLLNVLGMIELAAATTRTQEQQFNAEKTEMATLLLRERSEKGQLENKLAQEHRMRKIYSKRWREAQAAKDSAEAELNALRNPTNADKTDDDKIVNSDVGSSSKLNGHHHDGGEST